MMLPGWAIILVLHQPHCCIVGHGHVVCRSVNHSALDVVFFNGFITGTWGGIVHVVFFSLFITGTCWCIADVVSLFFIVNLITLLSCR